MKKIILSSIIFCLSSFSSFANHHEKPDFAKHEKMFEKIDSDKNNEVSKYEWQKHHNERFAEMDENQDGSLTKEEAKNFHDKKMQDRKVKK